jgi:hypothetical protein
VFSRRESENCVTCVAFLPDVFDLDRAYGMQKIIFSPRKRIVIQFIQVCLLLGSDLLPLAFNSRNVSLHFLRLLSHLILNLLSYRQGVLRHAGYTPPAPQPIEIRKVFSVSGWLVLRSA